MAIISVLEDGPRNYILNIESLADEDITLVDVSALSPPCHRVRLDRVTYDVGIGASAGLFWVPGDELFASFTEGNGQTMCFKSIGGINNKLIDPATSLDVRLVTVVPTPNQGVSMVLHFVKKYRN